MSSENPSHPPYSCLPLRTVLIGTSLEEESDGVVKAGLAVARAAGGRVYLVHAVRINPPLVGFELGGGLDLTQDQVQWHQEALDQQIERLGIEKAELAGSSLLIGAAHQVVSDVAHSVGADLIVVGATGSGPLAAELLGSTADRILRKASCPVLVVRGGLQLPPRRALAPVDLSEASGDAFRCGMGFLAQLAKGGDTEVRVVYALSFLDAIAFQRRHQGGEAADFEKVQALEAEELRRFVMENGGGVPFRVETAVLPGEARFEILQELVERPADLVLLGTHGRGGFDRLVLGSVASTVARKAPCSVLLIPPDAAFTAGTSDGVSSPARPAL